MGGIRPGATARRPTRCIRSVADRRSTAKPLYSLSDRTARMDTEKEARKRSIPDEPRRDEDDRRGQGRDEGQEEPKPWAPPPRRKED